MFQSHFCKIKQPKSFLGRRDPEHPQVHDNFQLTLIRLKRLKSE